MPVIGLLATGSEVLLPGRPPEQGKLFASNVILQQGWLTQRHFQTVLRHAGDDHNQIRTAVEQLAEEADVLLTSGGAWKGDRDLIESVLESLGWQQIFHRVRMGPGKAVGMGLLHDKPIFCLPGGPTSNAMAFWMIAVPAICKMAGHRHSPFSAFQAPLEKEIHGDGDWTQFVDCRIMKNGNQIVLRPEKNKSRLLAIARTQAIVIIPEGVSVIPVGTEVSFLCINRNAFHKGGLQEIW
jgi:molybdopterin molybdotransferase